MQVKIRIKSLELRSNLAFTSKDLSSKLKYKYLTMPELLFEIGTEELPPSSINSLTNQVKGNIVKSLKENNICVSEKDIKTYNTPRRIAVYIKNLPKVQEVKTLEVKGPDKEKAFDKNGTPTQAAIGFAKKYNLEPKDLTVKKINNAEYVFAVTKIGGQETKDLLAKILPDSLRQTTGDKFISWGIYDEKFSRPIRWILAILDNETISFTYAGTKSNNYTYGHRFLSKDSIKIISPSQYEDVLEKNYVIASYLKRKNIIKESVTNEAKRAGRIAILDDSLIEEVANITEYPDSLLCEFEPNFLSLPSCVIQTVLKKHQKYFVIKLADSNELSNNFIVITNGNDSIKIANGNEKVVRARLSDANFFFIEDQKRLFTYEERIKDLSKTTFQKGLGSMEEKVIRITKLSEYTYKILEEQIKAKLTCSKDDIISTAKLCKLDLSTHMVFELPELQGAIGSEYAKINGFKEAVCEGIKEHYNQCPKGVTGFIVGLADKLDNIICLFAIGKIPSGSTDPFALRRQAQGIINSILDVTSHGNTFSVNLSELFKYYKNNVVSNELKSKLTTETEKLIKEFLLERFESSMDISFGYEQDIIKAVCSVEDPLSDIIRTKEKIEILNKSFIKPSEANKAFLVAAKRLVRIVEKTINGNVDTSNLKTEYEKELLNKINHLQNKQYKTFKDLLEELQCLTEAINTFFDKVLVNDPDPKIKNARQSLLKKGKDLFEKACDFNQIIERN
ncbi:MAG: glycine--tRNA ligase subunit beta [Candidatus Melainabacteria bacterium]|nr:glycine--tRNA ligase subunit beta [Candidatus Melainabacteria bacterium]